MATFVVKTSNLIDVAVPLDGGEQLEFQVPTYQFFDRKLRARWDTWWKRNRAVKTADEAHLKLLSLVLDKDVHASVAALPTAVAAQIVRLIMRGDSDKPQAGPAPVVVKSTVDPVDFALTDASGKRVEFSCTPFDFMPRTVIEPYVAWAKDNDKIATEDEANLKMLELLLDPRVYRKIAALPSGVAAQIIEHLAEVSTSTLGESAPSSRS